jgi:hypothetical protein
VPNYLYATYVNQGAPGQWSLARYQRRKSRRRGQLRHSWYCTSSSLPDAPATAGKLALVVPVVIEQGYRSVGMAPVAR